MKVIGYVVSNGTLNVRTRVIVVERAGDVTNAINLLAERDNVPYDEIVVNPVLEPVDPKELH
jgi:hypothetical protein